MAVLGRARRACAVGVALVGVAVALSMTSVIADDDPAGADSDSLPRRELSLAPRTVGGRGFSGQIAGAVGWLVRKRSVGRDVAEEAVQEALLQLAGLSARMWPRDPEAWLRRAAERRLIDGERRRRTQLPVVGDGRVVEQSEVGMDLDAVLALRAALLRLDPQRRALVVRRLAGDSWSDVARASGLDDEVARKRFARALEELRSFMAE